MIPALQHLNPEQLRAATTIDGFNFVLAGAGSGKTSVLVARIAYMIHQGVDPENILLITFTNKAAKEMRDRVVKLLGDVGSKISAFTFHSFCSNVMHKHASLMGMANDFVISDEADQIEILNVVKDTLFALYEASNMDIDVETLPSNHTVLKIYSYVANNACPIERAFNEYKTPPVEQEYIKTMLSMFAKYKREHNVMDYDDLLVYTSQLLRQRPDIREKLDKKYQYIMCDEYQDTNPIQNDIINAISVQYPNLMVVGDDNQSIYAFRHADINNILDFRNTHPGCKEFLLSENYRSTQEILDLANAMMSHATEGIEKKLHGQKRGARPELVKCNNAYDEADWIVQDILAHDIPREKIAVIMRSGTQSYILENKLARMGIGFNKYGGMKFMEKVIIKDLLAFLRILHSAKDELAMMRILQLFSGIGAKTAHNIAKAVGENGYTALTDTKLEKKPFFRALYSLQITLQHLTALSLSEQIDYLINDYYYVIAEEKIKASNKSVSAKNELLHKLKDSKQDAEALADMTAGYKSISSFLSDVVLEATHKTEDTANKVNITTIHSAKGLQYHTVYILDCVEGVTPRANRGSREEPEELRCMYVAVTRAQQRLVLMYPQYLMQRRTDGDMYIPASLSRFIAPYNVRQTFDDTRAIHLY